MTAPTTTTTPTTSTVPPSKRDYGWYKGKPGSRRGGIRGTKRGR
jgi:hypothetical protein